MAIRDLDLKKAGLIVLFIFVVFLFGYLLYIFFFKSASDESVATQDEGDESSGEGLVLSDEELVLTTQDQSTTLGLPPISGIDAGAYISPVASGGVTHVSTLVDSRTSGFNLAANGLDLLYYNTNDSRFYRVTPDGKISLLVDKRFFDIDSVSFSTAKDKAIVEYPDGANLFYNFNTAEQITLPQHWEQFEFSQKTDNIAFKNIGINPENNLLAVSNADGTGAKLVVELGSNEHKVDINWSPDNRVVATFANTLSNASSGEQQEILFLGQNNENFKSILVEGYGFEGQWSQTGDRMIYSVHGSDSDFKPEVWVVNAQGNAAGSGRRNLKIETWAHKCTFGSNTEVFCAVPNSIETGYGFNPSLNNSVPDSFYKINLNTGARELLALPDGNYTAESVSISQDGQYLYFVDVSTGKLHKIKL